MFGRRPYPSSIVLDRTATPHPTPDATAQLDETGHDADVAKLVGARNGFAGSLENNGKMCGFSQPKRL